MDGNGDIAASDPNNTLVFLTFFQHTGCVDPNLQRELALLGRELKCTQPDINSNIGVDEEYVYDDEELQTDGHFSPSCRVLLEGIQAERHLPVNHEEVEVVRNVAAGLIEISDQINHNVLAQAAENLAKKLQKSSIKLWQNHLAEEVKWLLCHCPGSALESLPQEKVIMAFTLSLVKRVCEKAPLLLRNLFLTTLQYFSQATA